MTGFESEVKEAVTRQDQNPLGLYSSVQTVDSAETTSVDATAGTIYLVDASSASVTINLPQPKSEVIISTVKKIDGSTNAVNIETADDANIDGSASLSITTQYTSREVVNNEANYFIV